MATPKFDRLTCAVPSEGAWDAKENVLHVSTPHAFTQATGYAKYVLGLDGNVYFRGQAQVYADMVPRLFRGANNWSGVHRREEALNKVIKGSIAAFIPDTPEYAREPLLQHYFLRTRWLDLVDNAWIALWFASHEVHTTGRDNEFAHFVPRRTGAAYVVLVSAGQETPDSARPGLVATPQATLVDLRRAAPSLYLRPHAQHGLLFRRTNISTVADASLQSFVIGTIRVDVTDANSWLGGSMLSVHHLFPPPRYDHGYRTFLERPPMHEGFVGRVAHIGA